MPKGTKILNETPEQCKARWDAYRQKWRDNNPEKMLEYRLRTKEQKKEYDRKRLAENPKEMSIAQRRSILVQSAKVRARNKSLPIDLRAGDFSIPEYCPVLGIKLEHHTSHGCKSHSPTLDRFVPGLGYVKDNINVISMKANSIKGSHTYEELKAVVEWMERIMESRCGNNQEL